MFCTEFTADRTEVTMLIANLGWIDFSFACIAVARLRAPFNTPFNADAEGDCQRPRGTADIAIERAAPRG